MIRSDITAACLLDPAMSLRAFFTAAVSRATAHANARRSVQAGLWGLLTLAVGACGDDQRKVHQVAVQVSTNEAAKHQCFERGLHYYIDVKAYTRVKSGPSQGRLVTEVISERCAASPNAF